MSIEESIKAVRDYLEKEFPGWTVEDGDEAGGRMRFFRISGEGKIHNTVVTREFLLGRSPDDIDAALTEFLLAEHLREMGTTKVFVMNEGLEA